MRVFVIAGEASGDKLGGAVMAGLKAMRPDVTFDGVGGERMQAEGLASRFEMSELSVMGLAEVLPRYRQLKARIRELSDAIVAARPDLLLTIDSPDFCLRVAREVRDRAPVRCVHYVAPTIWAWRPRRAEKLKGVVDQLLALLPFEPDYWSPHGIRCDFVGHPVVAERQASPAEVQAFRTGLGIEGPLLCVLPGSRKGEVSRLAPVFGEAVARTAREVPGLTAILPVAPGLEDLVTEATSGWPVRPRLLHGKYDKAAAFAASDAALAASGTVSLELAAAGTPMAIAYDMAWLSRLVISRMLQVDTVTLVNLVSDTRAVPEFIGADCRPGPIARALAAILRDPGAQSAAMALTMDRLGRGGAEPGRRAAAAILSGLDG